MLSLIGLVSLAGCGGPQWIHDPSYAFRQAAQRDDMVLVYYRAGVCEHCTKMDRDVFTDSEVLAQLRGFVLLQRDYTMWGSEAAKLGINGTPGFVVHRANGTVVGSPAVGEMSSAEFRAFLAAARLQK
jgi:thiol:disulfide interchange protein